MRERFAALTRKAIRDCAVTLRGAIVRWLRWVTARGGDDGQEWVPTAGMGADGDLERGWLRPGPELAVAGTGAGRWPGPGLVVAGTGVGGQGWVAWWPGVEAVVAGERVPMLARVGEPVMAVSQGWVPVMVTSGAGCRPSRAAAGGVR